MRTASDDAAHARAPLVAVPAQKVVYRKKIDGEKKREGEENEQERKNEKERKREKEKMTRTRSTPPRRSRSKPCATPRLLGAPCSTRREPLIMIRRK